MDLSNAAKWTLFNRLITAGAMLFGTAIAVFGFVLGFWGSIETLLIDGNVQTAVESANPVITLTLAALGFLVWQIGKTYALFWSLPRASGRAAARRFDHGRLKSEVVEALDERLAEMEEDVAETRRSVQELKRSEHAAAFDEREVLESEIDQRTESIGTPQANSSENRSAEQAASPVDVETSQTNTQPDEQLPTNSQQTTPTDDRHSRDERADRSAGRTPNRQSRSTATQPQAAGTQEQTTGTQEQTSNTQPQKSETESRSSTTEPTRTETQVADTSAPEEATGPTGRSQDQSVEDGAGQSTTNESAESGFEFSNAERSDLENTDERSTTPTQSDQPTADNERSSSESAPEGTDRSEPTDTDEDASSSDSEDPLA